MKKTLAWMLCLSPLAVFACSEVADRDQKDVENAVSTQLPLTAACSQCAADALATTCKPELDACANDPNCLDVPGCLQACAPQDLACFAQCAAASVPFEALTDCVFCNACTQECAGQGTCGPQTQPPPPPPGNGGNFGACGQCILQGSTNQCHDLAQQCLGSNECLSVAQCVETCGLTQECVQQCSVNASQATHVLLDGLYQCATTSPCAAPCVGNGGGSNNSCQACTLAAAQNQCSQYFAACTSTPGCQQIAICASQCGDLACAQACFANGAPAAVAAATDLAQCAVCDVCTSECPQQACP